MIILGITHPISWNPAACLLIDGQLLAFAEEERFVRLKHAPHIYPERAIEFCLKRAGVRYADIDVTAIGFEQPGPIDQEFFRSEGTFEPELDDIERFRYLTQIGHIHADAQLTTFGKRQYFDHHLCHAASAAVPSGFDATNVITLDGWGGASSGMLGFFSKTDGFTKHFDINPLNSWGMLYELITEYLGFMCHSGEGKTMGLASFGQVDTNLLPDFCEPELGLPDVKRYETYMARNFARREKSADFENCHRNLAATVQFYYERSLQLIGSMLKKRTGSGYFAMAGGVALNCAGNGKFANSELVDKLFVQPASHDAGTALGAAILAHNKATGSWPNIGFDHAYWGEEFTPEQILSAIDFAGILYEQCDGPSAAAEALSRNEIVGWFQGGAEVGPRALGNRSILANPGDAENLKKINLQVKRRELWRPLAPSVLEENYFDVFATDQRSPFMLLACPVRDNWRDRLPAVTHVDGSARPQLVSSKTNPRFHELIQKFQSHSGLPCVLNTSFNLNDEPLVNSPEHAIATFFRSGIETLVIGDYLIRKGA